MSDVYQLLPVLTRIAKALENIDRKMADQPLLKSTK
jgi:hypothetical protein